MTATNSLSLRDRKREETRAAIETAALDLVLTDGPETTTVDAIAARAGVSQRTFFNYFESKDAAILGALPRAHAAALLAEYRDQAPLEDIALTVVRLVMLLTGAHERTAGAHLEQRRELLRRHPQVLARQADQLAHRADALIETVHHLLAADPGFEDPALHRDQASVLVMLAGVAVRRAVNAWSQEYESPGHSPGVTVEQFVEERAVHLLRATARSLA